MLTKKLDTRIRELEADLTREQEKYVNSIKSHEDYITIQNIRDDVLARKFELESLYAQRK